MALDLQQRSLRPRDVKWQQGVRRPLDFDDGHAGDLTTDGHPGQGLYQPDRCLLDLSETKFEFSASNDQKKKSNLQGKRSLPRARPLWLASPAVQWLIDTLCSKQRGMENGGFINSPP